MAPLTKPQPQPPALKEPDNHFTVFIRLPFPRGDFVDPPAIDWDSSKDRTLWKILSRASKGSEIDWHVLADQFDVSLPFLLQQAAWLYERQLSQVKAQLRKVSKPASSGSSPTPGSISGSATAAGHAMRRGGSGGSHVPSLPSLRARDSPTFKSEGSRPNMPRQPKPPQASRVSSTNTIFQTSKHTRLPHQPNDPSLKQGRQPLEADHQAPEASSTAKRRSQESPPKPTSTKTEPSSSSSSSSSDSDTPAPLSHSRAFVRRPRFTAPKSNLGPLSDEDADDDDDEDAPAFLPFSAATTNPAAARPTLDPSATIRANVTKPAPQTPLPNTKRANPSAPTHTHSSSSSTSSAHPQPSSQPSRSSTNPVLALSPRQRRIAKEGSEGTPSMGSSFSDLDDASVTQSALEEALAREIAQGGGSIGVASRMSTISQALRSRYL
ncbi:hypothetical protein MMC24_006526 [Lignoscripta atroalba]|nr:hypothetical protein [Lignoscripta atroalba]